MINVGVVGYGYWGPNIVRNFFQSGEASVAYVADQRDDRLSLASSLYPAIKTVKDADKVFEDPSVDAVAIATPVSTHADLAMKALRAGKHVLVEKPLADSSEKCKRLIDEADRQGRILMVDHTFPYTGAVRKAKELVDAGELGDILYYDSTRINLGLFQHDVNVIWDLAVHDLTIIDFLFADKPVSVSCTGINHFEDHKENIAYLTLFFEPRMIAHIHVNWLSPVKVRQVLVGGTKKMLVYNDLDPAEKLKVYDKGVTIETDPKNIYKMRVGYRSGDMFAPQLDDTEALTMLVSHFVDCISSQREPITGAHSGLQTVRMMEAAAKSMSSGGALVNID